MTKELPEQATTLFKEFREMQARHAAALEGREYVCLPDFNDERRAMLQRFENLFATLSPDSSNPVLVKKELEAILTKEEELKKKAAARRRKTESELESLRVGKKVLNRYGEKGCGTGTSPCFVSRST